MHNAITDIEGISVGHWTHRAGGTGCTVILCPQGAVGGVDVRGGAPGTRELSLLDPTCTVDQVHAVLLSGGSAFGLAAADGVMQWLEERGHGFDVGVTHVPIVPAAILFDLSVGRADIRPDAAAGYAACEAAAPGPVAEGTIGAGTGATVGKLLGFPHCTKGGVGTASRHAGDGVMIAALAVINAVGDVMEPATGQVIAGARHPQTGHFGDTLNLVYSETGISSSQWVERKGGRTMSAPEASQAPGQAAHGGENARLGNTTLVVVATNVALNKAGATKVAQMAHDGLARSIRPVHTAVDGDTVFALSLGDKPGDAGLIGTLAAEVTAQAIVRAARAATSIHGIPAAQEDGSGNS